MTATIQATQPGDYPDHPDHQATLRRVYAGLVRRFLEVLEGDEVPKAAMLSVIRAFLHDQRIDADSLSRGDAVERLRAMAEQAAGEVKAGERVAWAGLKLNFDED